MNHFFKSNSFFGKCLRWPMSLIPPKSRMWVLSGPIKGKRWIAGSNNHGCWLGIYEKAKMERFTQEVLALSSKAVIYDFGAHAGIYSLVAAVQAPNSTIHAFEPVPNNLQYLSEHLKLNRINNVVVHSVSVGNISGPTRMTIGHSSTTSKVSTEGSLTVSQIQIDEEVNSGRLPPPNLIKIDIEGGEWDALMGAKETLQKFHPKLFLATHSPDIHQQCLNLLTEIGYHFVSLNSQTVALGDEIYAYWEKETLP